MCVALIVNCHHLGYLVLSENVCKSFVEKFTSIEEIPKNATETASGFWGQLRETAVIIPRVPSDPMKSCLRS